MNLTSKQKKIGLGVGLVAALGAVWYWRKKSASS